MKHFSKMVTEKGIVLCTKENGVFLVIECAEELIALRQLLDNAVKCNVFYPKPQKFICVRTTHDHGGVPCSDCQEVFPGGKG